MRAAWTGYVSFGMVNVPVKVYKGTEDRSIRFNQLHAADGGRIKQVKSCSVCGETLGTGDICRGFEHDKGQYVTFTDAELDRGLGGVRGIEIVRFVDSKQIDPAFIDSTYYLGPDDSGSSKTRMPPSPQMLGTYKLLVAAMQLEDCDALARVTVRERERMGILRIRTGHRGDVLALDMLRWSDEVRDANDVDYIDMLASISLPPEQIEMARRLVANMRVEHLGLSEYVDTYRRRVERLVAMKLGGEEIPAEDDATSAPVIDLMAALSASIEASERKEAVNE